VGCKRKVRKRKTVAAGRQNTPPFLHTSSEIFKELFLTHIHIHYNEVMYLKFYVVKIKMLLSVLVLTALVLLFFVSGRYISANTSVRQIPVYSIENDNNQIAITFDCAWSAEDIPDIVNILNKYNCKAVFFAVGNWAEKYPDMVRLLHENGHTIANHSYSHPHYNSMSKSEMLADMDKCDNVIMGITGEKPTLFRSPYGEYNNSVIDVCRENNHEYIQWSVDSLDWKDISADEIYKRITEKTKSGDILLFHNGTKHTSEVLPKILDTLSKKYRFALVEDMLIKDDYTIDSAGRQRKK